MTSALSSLAPLLLLVLLAACAEPAPAPPEMASEPAPAMEQDEPPPESADAQEAAGVIRRYYEAIGAGDFRRAYDLWGDEGRSSGQTFEQFEAGFGETERVAVEVGEPGRVEGAAGSRFVEVPVTVRAMTTTGEAQRFEGTYTLRRTVVEGSTPAQRRWHLFSADLAPVR